MAAPSHFDAPRPGGTQGVEQKADLGPFFSTERYDPAHPPTDPWRSMQEILDDPRVLDDRVAGVRASLAAGGGLAPEAVELRVAASVTQLGLAARLASPLLAAAVLDHRVPALTLRELFWQPRLGGAFPLSLPLPLSLPHSAPGARARDTDVADALGAVLIDGMTAALEGAVARFGVSRRIARGNTASALAGAARVLGTARRDRGARARELVDALLTCPTLDGSGHHLDDGGFRRRSCCLIYRAAPDRKGQLCGDCVLQR
ncbi:(2Fe-2S)-binding protein [Streptacidiphilus sp. EB129]|uniref:(2Fe-2S)-binding protein n=1 Tax=Streptacidiphilus sp. EB129 TaxID=3156262 RepID=UPI0035184282